MSHDVSGKRPGENSAGKKSAQKKLIQRSTGLRWAVAIWILVVLAVFALLGEGLWWRL